MNLICYLLFNTEIRTITPKPDLDCVMLLDLLIYFSLVRTQTGCALEICTKTELLKKNGEL